LPAAYFLDWIKTLTVSTGWITDVAITPEIDPTIKGLTRDASRLSFGLGVSGTGVTAGLVV